MYHQNKKIKIKQSLSKNITIIKTCYFYDYNNQESGEKLIKHKIMLIFNLLFRAFQSTNTDVSSKQNLYLYHQNKIYPFVSSSASPIRLAIAPEHF